ncbi:MAG: LysR family transcriptional regulator [Alphaproteobacteria bacterium]|nr:MAG: LysR family transcriptional regulator [Alphaproteobacteria bacterium]
MDIEFARTFLAVIETGSFLKAAEKVHATQSTVSMRIKVIEERLGQALFERRKTGVVLTPAGEKFQRHALQLVRIWDQARRDASLPEGIRSTLAVGGQYSLWDGFLLNWVAEMRSQHGDLGIEARFAPAAQLMDMLALGVLDLAVMYSPQVRPVFRAEYLFDEELVLVTSEADGESFHPDSYIQMDWGQGFQAELNLTMPMDEAPILSFDLGSLGVRYLLDNPASGYLPLRVVKPYLEDGRLRRVKGVPQFSYSAYAVYGKGTERAAVDAARLRLVEVAKRIGAQRGAR